MYTDKELESSIFYNKRYGSFSSYSIWIFLIGFILLLIFVIFTKKEITVKSTGTLAPKSPLAVVQSSSSKPIIENKLKEGKLVQKGDLLVKYEDDSISANRKTITFKRKDTYNRTNELNKLKQSITLNKNLLTDNDTFGFKEQFDDYKSQLDELTLSTQQTNSDIQESDISSNKKKRDIQRNNEILLAKKNALKSNKLSEINEQINSLLYSDIDLSNQETSLDEEINSYQVTSPRKGILHLKFPNSKQKFLSNGEEIAEIYPVLDSSTELISSFFVPADQVNGLKKNQRVRFKLNKKGPRTTVLNGNVKSIDTAPSNSQEEPAYRVTASIFPSHKQYDELRYGQIGDVTVVTGTKTWFNYFKDQFFPSK